MVPRPGSAIAARHRKSWSSSFGVGTLKLVTSTPCGFTPLMTCWIVPSFPAASMAWMMTSRDARSWAARRAWYSERSAVPWARSFSASFSFTPAVSAGSWVLPSLTFVSGATRRRAASLRRRAGSWSGIGYPSFDGQASASIVAQPGASRSPWPSALVVLRDRQLEPELRAALGPVPGPDPATQQIHDAVRDREAEPDPGRPLVGLRR